MQRQADDWGLSDEHSIGNPNFCQKVQKGAKRCRWAKLRTLRLQSSDDEPVCRLLIAKWVSASSLVKVVKCIECFILFFLSLLLKGGLDMWAGFRIAACIQRLFSGPAFRKPLLSTVCSIVVGVTLIERSANILH